MYSLYYVFFFPFYLKYKYIYIKNIIILIIVHNYYHPHYSAVLCINIHITVQYHYNPNYSAVPTIIIWCAPQPPTLYSANYKISQLDVTLGRAEKKKFSLAPVYATYVTIYPLQVILIVFPGVASFTTLVELDIV